MDSLQNLIVRIEELKQQKKFDDAVSIIQTSISKYSEDYRLYEELADIFLYRGEFDKAMKAVDFSL
jgi:tetratricopeptide (TPR) repeat protein